MNRTAGEVTAEVPVVALGIGPEVHADIPTEESAVVEDEEPGDYTESRVWVFEADGSQIARQLRIEEAAAFLLQASQSQHALELAKQLPPFQLSVNRVLSLFGGVPGVYGCAEHIAAKAPDESQRNELQRLIDAYRAQASTAGTIGEHELLEGTPAAVQAWPKDTI
jgi:hypothetical protein